MFQQVKDPSEEDQPFHQTEEVVMENENRYRVHSFVHPILGALVFGSALFVYGITLPIKLLIQLPLYLSWRWTNYIVGSPLINYYYYDPVNKRWYRDFHFSGSQINKDTGKLDRDLITYLEKNELLSPEHAILISKDTVELPKDTLNELIRLGKVKDTHEFQMTRQMMKVDVAKNDSSCLIL